MKTQILIYRTLFQRITLVLFIFVLSNGFINAQNINYKSQSLYIYIFTKNISWPEINQKGDFSIGVFGNSPIFDELTVMATLKKAGTGQKIVIKKINSLEDITNEHIIYIASSKSRELNSIIDRIDSKPTLIVAERDGLARKGASINFMVMEDDNLKFEVNTLALRKHNLKISDGLLQRGFVVK